MYSIPAHLVSVFTQILQKIEILVAVVEWGGKAERVHGFRRT